MYSRDLINAPASPYLLAGFSGTPFPDFIVFLSNLVQGQSIQNQMLTARRYSFKWPFYFCDSPPPPKNQQTHNKDPFAVRRAVSSGPMQKGKQILFSAQAPIFFFPHIRVAEMPFCNGKNPQISRAVYIEARFLFFSVGS